jgi:hypothetical protein
METFTRKLKSLDSYELAVIGGGIAGVSAAIAASRQGVKTILIEQFSELGGVATTGGTAAFCGETKGQGFVFDAIIEEMTRLNAIAPYRPYMESEARSFDHEILKIVLQELCLRNKVDLLFHTRVIETEVEHKKVKNIILHNASGLQTMPVDFVIDASGEATIAIHAGFEKLNEENDLQFNLPMSLNFFMRKCDQKILQSIPFKEFGSIKEFQNEEELPAVSIWPQADNKVGIKMKVPGFVSTNGASLSNAEIAARRKMWSVVNYLQRNKLRKFELSQYKLDYASPILGIREGRRIAGEYILSGDDVKIGKQFSTAIAVGVFYLDYMSPTSEKQTYEINWENRHIPPYQIPFECLIPKDSVNLLIAGRCFSADRLAFSSARVMTTCSMLGQAAGYGAALSLKNNSTIIEINYSELQKILLNNQALLETSAYKTLGSNKYRPFGHN